MQPRSTPANDDLRTAVLLTAGLTLARLVALFRSPLELYPDEAQYWLWSRTLEFGYYSKPPMIAWAIWAATRLGGDAEPWVRLASPLFQAGAGLAVFAIGRRLYGSAVGLAALAVYVLMPGVQLSALVAATDAPLLFFLALATHAYVALQQAQATVARRAWAAAFGAWLALAFLSKYAAIYALIGLALHLCVEPSARRVWRATSCALATASFILLLGPNLWWNAHHGFATFHHTAANADWRGRLPNPAELGEFLVAQFGVFGPIPFAVLVGGSVWMAWRRRLSPPDVLLLCFAAPPLLIISAQALISRANANWSGAGYIAGSVLVAAWLVRWRARRWMIGALALQAAVAALFLAIVVHPRLADRAGLDNGLKRARGWSQVSDAVLGRAMSGDYSAITVNNRFLFYALAYYGRDRFAQGSAPPLTAWPLAATPQNQAESTDPLTREKGRRVLAASYEGWRLAEMKADFQRTGDLEILRTWLGPRRSRKVVLFTAEGYVRRPRDPLTGLPTPP